MSTLSVKSGGSLVCISELLIAVFHLSVEIDYIEQRKNHGTMILHGLRYGSYCTYGLAPSSQSCLTFFRSFTRRVPWVVFTFRCVSPNITLLI